MSASAISGALFTWGDMLYMGTAFTGSPSPEYNIGAGPNVFYKGSAIPDFRLIYPKDQVTGFTGKVAAFKALDMLESIQQVPAAFGTANIAALQNVTSGTALTLAASSVGVTTNVPIVPYSQSLNGLAPVTAAIVLDFGFTFLNVTSGSTTATVSDSTLFTPGMPLVIGNVGNAGGTVPLLTNVSAILTATTIQLANAPLATNSAAPTGAGNLWGPSEIGTGFPTPTAHLPYRAIGAGLFLDPGQSVTRGVSITGVSGGTGGNFTVAGWDIYGQPMTETIAAAAGAGVTYGKKAFKSIASVTPAFTDAHNYSVGTSDVFGFAFRSTVWEYTRDSWNGANITANTGWTAADTTSPATSTTGDVRGTVQASDIGGGTPISGGSSSTRSNGSVSSLAMSGRRLALGQFISLGQMTLSNSQYTVPVFGVTQA